MAQNCLSPVAAYLNSSPGNVLNAIFCQLSWINTSPNVSRLYIVIHIEIIWFCTGGNPTSGTTVNLLAAWLWGECSSASPPLMAFTSLELQRWLGCRAGALAPLRGSHARITPWVLEAAHLGADPGWRRRLSAWRAQPAQRSPEHTRTRKQPNALMHPCILYTLSPSPCTLQTHPHSHCHSPPPFRTVGSGKRVKRQTVDTLWRGPSII